MLPSLKKKLVKNALQMLSDLLGNECCNDLEMNSPLLDDITKKEFQEIEKSWAKEYPQDAAALNGELICDITLVDFLIKTL